MAYQENFDSVLETVCGQRRMQENAWPEEQQEFAHDIMALLAKAYRAGYDHADEQYDGWRTYINPFEKEPETNA